MKTDEKIRKFYDEMYSANEKRNPAYHIYDRLRVNTIKHFSKGETGPVLIVGCGSNRDLQIINPELGVFAFDLSFEALQHIGKNQVHLFTADALNIPTRSGFFQLVICSEVLEHIPDIKAAVREIRRVMKPGGTLIVSSPNWISWFGLARFISMKLLRKDIRSSDQPYDDWKTWGKYRDELGEYFDVIQTRGVWYLIPLHYRNRGLPASLTNFIYFLFSPFERLLSRVIPKNGHLLVLKCTTKDCGG